MFLPFAQERFLTGGLVIRGDRDASTLISAVMQVIRRAAPLAPVEHVLTMAQLRDQSLDMRRLNAALMASFAGVSAVIAALGIASILAFSVASRTSEIGIRIALGANRAQIRGIILKEGGTLIVLGLAAGLVGAVLGARLLQRSLYNVVPHDPLTLTVVMVAMAAIGLVACWMPARRAARIEPIVAIRTPSN
jgi:putative ABC transport system permease protein